MIAINNSDAPPPCQPGHHPHHPACRHPLPASPLLVWVWVCGWIASQATYAANVCHYSWRGPSALSVAQAQGCSPRLCSYPDQPSTLSCHSSYLVASLFKKKKKNWPTSYLLVPSHLQYSKLLPQLFPSYLHLHPHTTHHQHSFPELLFVASSHPQLQVTFNRLL